MTAPCNLAGTGFEVLSTCPTAILADVMDEMGISDFALDRNLKPLSRGRIAGPALCVSGSEGAFDRGRRSIYCDIDRAVTAGCVVVVATGGFDRAAVVGGNAAIAWKQLGCSGIVVDGVVRDVDELQELGLPCFCRGTSVLGFPSRWDYTAIGSAISIRSNTATDAAVAPGDFIIGDADGILVIPFWAMTVVCARAVELEHKQATVKKQLLAGFDRGATYYAIKGAE